MNVESSLPKSTRPHGRRNLLPALLLLTIAVLAALVGLPRPVPPTDVPLPRIARALDNSQFETERQRVTQTLNHGLPVEVRAVGELVREVGRIEAQTQENAQQSTHSQHSAELSLSLSELRKATQSAAQQHGGLALLKLRALQTQLFIAASQHPEVAGKPNADLLELGGAFFAKARKNGWFQAGRWTASEQELAAAYRIRWTRLLGLAHVPAFQPSLNDWRHYYRLRLRHPDSTSRAPLDLAAARLADVRALSALDAAYPVHYASGVLTYQLGQPAEALEHFRKHLKLHPDGEWTLRARNALWACAVEIDATSHLINPAASLALALRGEASARFAWTTSLFDGFFAAGLEHISYETCSNP